MSTQQSKFRFKQNCLDSKAFVIFSRPPKKYKIVPHVRPLRSSNGLAGINHNTPIVDNYSEDHGIGGYPQIPPPDFTGMYSQNFSNFA